MFRQVREHEIVNVAALEVAQPDCPEIRGEDEARHLRVRRPVRVAERLLLRAEQVAALRFLLDDQLAGPEEVDEARIAGVLAHRRLVGPDAAALHPEGAEERVVEALRLALLVMRARPVAREIGGAGANLRPGQMHGLCPTITRATFRSGTVPSSSVVSRARVRSPPPCARRSLSTRTDSPPR